MFQMIASFYEWMSVGQEKVVDEWFMMRSPIPIVAIVAAYLYFVLKAGPKMMENRKPFNLKWILVIYNGIQVLFSVWICAQAFMCGDMTKHIFTMGCRYTFPKTPEYYFPLWQGAWWYFMAKITELLDTVFFVLRKKQNQVSFLHVYHHSVMAIWAFVYLKYIFSEQGLLIGYTNSMIHIPMYFYYMVAALGPAYQKYIWWKKYMTAMQLIQFCVMIVTLGIGLALECHIPRIGSAIMAFLIVSFLYLFSRFYQQSYVEKASRNGKMTEVDENNNDVKSLKKSANQNRKYVKFQ